MSVTDAAGNTTRYTYNGADILMTSKDPGGATYAYQYNNAGMLTGVVMPDGQVHEMDYSAVRDRTSYTAPGSPPLTTSYDLDRETTGRGLPDGRSIARSFDAGGQLSRVVDDTSTATSTYDAVSRDLTALSRTVAGTTPSNLAFTYDGPLLKTQTVSGPSQGTFEYSYNDVLDPVSISSLGQAAVALGYDKDALLSSFGPFTVSRDADSGRAKGISGGGPASTYSYDGSGRLASTSLGTDAYAMALTYDVTSLIASKTEKVGSGAAVRLDYGYNADGRLVSVARDGTAAESYAYDADGNRVARRRAGEATETAVFDSSATSVGGVACAYDGAGFLKTRGSWSFSYDAWGGLRSARLAGGKTITYACDALGRRVTRTDGAKIWQYFYGDPADPTWLTAVKGPDGTVSELSYDDAGSLVAMRRAGAWYRIATDQVGSPRVVTDDAGTIVKTVEYDAFGLLKSDSAPAFEMPLGFAGGLADPDTGLVRFLVRDYDVASGTWTASDPIQFESGQANLYSYVDGDPVNRVDPSGLRAPAPGSSGKITVLAVNMTVEPRYISTACYELSRGEEYTFIKSQGDWYYVKVRNNEGWIHRRTTMEREVILSSKPSLYPHDRYQKGIAIGGRG